MGRDHFPPAEKKIGAIFLRGKGRKEGLQSAN